jgi:hypothetical protein
MTKLTDIQLILLTTAVQRPDGNILPPPQALGDQAARIRKAIPPLLKRALVEEVTVSDAAQTWRKDGDLLIGLGITDAGRAMIAVQEMPEIAPVMEALVIEPTPSPKSKIGLVVELLRREHGATLAELVTATQWLPHTTRAALTGLRKKGHVLEKGTRDGATAYLIKAA